MKIENRFILRQIMNDYVIVPVGKTVLDFNGVITINETGAFLWERMQEEFSISSLVEAVLNEYDIDRQQAQKDVEDFIEVLKDNNIL